MIIEYTKRYSQRVFVIENLPLIHVGHILQMLLESPYTRTVTARFQ